tara:strand:+ start:79 stop:927 length:849 start_codon:yes stop_codon:yes gene_type:complete
MKKLLLVLLLIPFVSFGQTTTTTIVVDENGNKLGTETENGFLITRTSTSGKTNTAIRQRSPGMTSTYEADGTTFTEFGSGKPNSTSTNSDGSFTTYDSQGNSKTYKNGLLISETTKQQGSISPTAPSFQSQPNLPFENNNRKGGIEPRTKMAINPYANNNKLDGVSDDTYDKLGDAAGQLAALILIKRADKKHYKYINEYKSKPTLENAFEIEKAGRKAIFLTENTAKIINSSSNNKNYNSNFKGATSIKDKWAEISEDHKLIIIEHKTLKKYKKYLKKNKK